MNSEPKPFASLSSGLLARKGAAKPAMRPQGFGQVGNGLEDLGWNDMGFEPPKPAPTSLADADHDAFGEVVQAPSRNPLAGLTPVDSPVHSQQAEIAGRLSTYEPDDAGEEEDETAELYVPELDAADVGDPQVDDVAPAPVVALAGTRMKTVAETVVPSPAPRRSRQPRPAPGSKDRAAFTLRLDADRHLKLRLACAIDGRSAQQFVTQALDHLLDSMPELEALAEKAKRKG
ncbi:hypothetical protein G7078_07105 [Sphingomonas sinipercae]|uniref:Uncharacterized protein n=1 Tax=Sphingomonas sinipercae TaxID=2714944 RepID=A0A6G7ZNK3_9SPHN|nr:hypothetical protein [Sphingomonas sinipercae]QIL02577.1 hypothetical protein G7078_07105 [Sphingomonas sinipercae]